MNNVEIITAIREILTIAGTMKNSYFFNSPCSAHARRDYEKRYSRPEISWNEGKDHYTAEYIVTCSCHKVYANGIYTKNGKKTNITAVRNSMLRLENNIN